ncbi:hypothetical protein D4R51_00310 [bacterium]|nr:MAG: hypothetical protein D4R51_00310 [bacterium]
MEFIRKTKEEKGSILIESIVGISLVVIGMVGIITLLTRSSVFYNSAVNKLKATYLAAEGIEIVKNIMDTKYVSAIAGNSWPAQHPADGWYYIDNTTPSSFIPLLNPPIPAAAAFVSVNSVTTIFRRIVNVQDNGNYLDVKSYVNWSETGSSKQVLLEDYFYLWRPNIY